jgi:hypothetical protein
VQLTFIIGPPRSGTTLLKDLLSFYPQLSVHGESFHPFHHDLGLFSHRLDKDGHFHLTTADASPDIRASYLNNIQSCLNKAGCYHFVLKISTLSIQIDYVKALFPKARFIQLVRDGRDSVCSMEQLRSALEAEEGSVRRLGPAPDPLGLWIAQHHPSGHLRAAGSWFFHVTRSWLDLRFMGADSYRRYRYEDLVSDPLKVIQDIEGFLDLTPSETVRQSFEAITNQSMQRTKLGFSTVQASSGRSVGRHQQDLDPNVKTLVTKLFYFPMRLLAYSPDFIPTTDDVEKACERLGLDVALIVLKIDELVEEFQEQVEAFLPRVMLEEPPLTLEQARPMLVDGALVSHRRVLSSGKWADCLGVVQKQDRRFEFADPKGIWVELATRLDGVQTLSELKARFGSDIVSLIESLFHQGYVGFLKR